MMKRKLLVVLLAATMMLSFAACGPKEPAKDVVKDAATAYFTNMPDDGYKIDNTKFVQAVIAGETDDMFILDIRQADVYAQSHVKGAVNAPWGPAIAEALPYLPKDKTIMVYCYTGQTAGQAVMTLNMAGYNAKSVHFGWNLGISKVAGFEAATETTVNALDKAKKNEIDPKIVAAITEYYAGLAKVAGTTFANYKIDEQKLKDMIDAKDASIYVLSIRAAEDFAKGHIATAKNIPFKKGMEAQFNTLPTDKKIVVYCYTGQTSGQTVAGLKMLGYDAVSLNAGMGKEANAPAGWANKGFPVVTD